MSLVGAVVLWHPVTILTPLALVLVFFAFQLMPPPFEPNGHGEGIMPKPGEPTGEAYRIRVGDLLLTIPKDWTFKIKFKVGHYNSIETGPKAPPPRNIIEAESIDFIVEDAWRISGTHPNAKGYEPSLMVIRIVSTASELSHSFTCRPGGEVIKFGQNLKPSEAQSKTADFYIFDEGHPWQPDYRLPIRPLTLFDEPVVFGTMGQCARSKTNFLGCTYSSGAPITHHAAVSLYFSSQDLTNTITPYTIVTTVETTIRSWIQDPANKAAFLKPHPLDLCFNAQ